MSVLSNGAAYLCVYRSQDQEETTQGALVTAQGPVCPIITQPKRCPQGACHLHQVIIASWQPHEGPS